ncbi:hypothetical protein C8R45DRAFT_942143 [Mycena sanguinolenta]|nr:hypothetical protein C8R45DRAFT_942143 [Mycena sanguinolenta]
MHEAFNGGVRGNCGLLLQILSKSMASVKCPISCAAKLVIVFSIILQVTRWPREQKRMQVGQERIKMNQKSYESVRWRWPRGAKGRYCIQFGGSDDGKWRKYFWAWGIRRDAIQSRKMWKQTPVDPSTLLRLACATERIVFLRIFTAGKVYRLEHLFCSTEKRPGTLRVKFDAEFEISWMMARLEYLSEHIVWRMWKPRREALFKAILVSIGPHREQ